MTIPYESMRETALMDARAKLIIDGLYSFSREFKYHGQPFLLRFAQIAEAEYNKHEDRARDMEGKC